MWVSKRCPLTPPALIDGGQLWVYARKWNDFIKNDRVRESDTRRKIDGKETKTRRYCS